MNKKEIWNSVLNDLKSVISHANFKTWFKETKIIKVEGDSVVIGVPHTFAQEWIQQKFHKNVLDSINQYCEGVTKIDYRIETSLQKSVTQAPSEGIFDNPKEAVLEAKPALSPPKIEPTVQNEVSINSSYTFENFIVGSSNRLAYAAAKAVVENPGESLRNPLYFYGGVGLGKTHLLQAIGNEILRRYKNKRVIYSPCEKFTNEYIQAIKQNKMDKLKDHYRTADVLLIDDIQFLAGKEGTQEEFFHTFNALHQDNRQIVMTSDSKPDMIPKMAERLSSRFNGGMVADFQTPDFETRQAILQQKCEEKNLPLTNEEIIIIAQHVQSNIRELEGVIKKIIVHCDLYNVEPNKKLIETIVKQVAVAPKNIHVSPDEILAKVAEHFSLDLGDIIGKKRAREVSYARQITMFLLREEMKYSHPKIGEFLGGRDHTTIMHGVNKITELKDSDELIGRDLSIIKERLYSFN